VPTYSSEGLLYALEEGGTFQEVFYLAGRPVAQRNSATGELLFLTTDHLGTPVLATDEAALEVWSGGFEPFGEDYAGAGAAGVFLRFPGQWVDGVWEEASLGARVFYNLHRWYETGTGRYTRPDPLGRRGDPNPYAYGRSNPLAGKDPFGLFRIKGPAPGCAIEYIQNQIPKLVDHPSIPANLARASGCSLAEVQEGLRWGSGPEIEFDDLAPGDAGEFDPTVPDQFRIDRPATEGVCGDCSCPDALLGLGISILHEYAHQLRQKCRGLETGPDVGDSFENATYGPGGSLGPSQAFLYGCP
jgi:RHS repeat-associated protein